jgi:2-oxoisovalerate dehydrogenase E1 component alpha subunit
MPAHWGSRDLNIISGSSPIATQIPHAAGIGYAIKYRGEDAVVGCWFGDGATSEGDWHEGMNFAGIHKLPLVFYCENNKYAISVPLSKQMAVPNVADKAAGYGMDGLIVEGSDVLACYQASSAAVDKARQGGGPTLIELKTYRFHPHTSDDDDRTYRSREEVDEAKRNDSLLLFAAYLKDQGLVDDDEIESIRAELKGEVDREVEEAWAAPDPEAESAGLHVFAESGGQHADGSAGNRKADALETTGGEATPADPPDEEPS